jgi:YfiH family protein
VFDGVPGLLHGFERRQDANGRETRAEARARLAAALEPSGRLLSLHQVHGAVVHAAPWDGTPDGDAGFATQVGQMLAIETADCLPVLIVDPIAQRVAAAHAGWRGTVARVAHKAVAALVARGSRPEVLLAALGPAIGACCYEVGEELRTAFGSGGERFFTPGARGRPHLDVRAANEAQLLAAGLRAEHIERLDECTYCRPALYHSYRRDGPGAGRMLSYVGFARG